MLTFRQLFKSIRRLNVPSGVPVIVHASLSAFGEIHGGAETLLGALLAACPRVMMPAFTYKTMVIPEVGPDNNGIEYGTGRERNEMAEFFHLGMPVDPSMGSLPERLRRHPKAKRSSHPILSFTGVGVDEALAAQTLEEPLAPIDALAEAGGYVLLLGVDHTVNISIHYAEKLAGRKQFLRWALTPKGVVACPGFPGCPDGFNQIEPYLESVTHRTTAGGARLQAIPLTALLVTARRLIEADPRALLPDSSDDPRVRDTLRAVGLKA